MDDAFERIAEIAAGQHGLVEVGAVRAAGLSVKRRRTLVRAGVLVPIGARAYRMAGSMRTGRQRLLEACMEVGGVATHRSATTIHGLGNFGLDFTPEVLVRDARQSARSTLARIHTTTWLPADDIVLVDSIPTTGVARTLFSLAALVPEISVETVAGVIDEAVRTSLATDEWLAWRLAKLRCRGRNGVSVFEEILTDRTLSPTESWLEREALRILRRAGLPLPDCQARIAANGATIARVDFRYRETTAIIEVNGHRYHSTREQLRRDARRRRALVAQGLAVYDFTYDEIVRDPESLVDTVTAILGLAAAA